MEKQIKTLQQLNLEDDFLFAKVMADEDVCRAVIEKLLGVKIKKVKLLAEQKDITIDFEAKGIRLDVYVEDAAGTVFAVEMQKGYEPYLPKRTRYYQGNIDLDLIQKGESYLKLRRSYVIFICTFDYFKKGRCRYTFENVCLEDGSIRLMDNTQKIVLNTKGTLNDVDEELQDFLKYVESSTEETAKNHDSPLLQKVHRQVEHVKNDKGMEVEYMTLYERDRRNFDQGKNEGLEQGRFEGLEQGRFEGLERGKVEGLEEKAFEVARNMILKEISPEIIAEVTGLLLEVVEMLKETQSLQIND